MTRSNPKEDPVSKETNNPTRSNAPFSPAPLFAAWRGAVDESERNVEQWMQYGAEQVGETVKVGRTLRTHALQALRGTIDAAEQLAGEALSVGNWSKMAARVQP